jgi:predicted transcriptional regulator
MAAKVNVSIKIDPLIKEQLESIADREDRTLSNQISSFVKRAVEQYFQENNLYWFAPEHKLITQEERKLNQLEEEGFEIPSS